MTKRKICIVVGSRANYSSIKSVMQAVKDHPDLELQLVTAASAVLDRYGAVVDLIAKDGFKSDAHVFMLVEGENPETMAKSTGLGLIELSSIFERLKPDVVLTIGDRFETMSTTLAAAYMNIPLAHTMGGEVSGNIDENIRHAISKFANIHFAASEDARQRIIKMGERPEIVHNTGCPRIDLVAEYLKEDIDVDKIIFSDGVGANFSTKNDFILVSQHPVTGEYGSGEEQVDMTLNAVKNVNLPALVLWPNADSGSEDVSRGIRKFREKNLDLPFHYIKNLPIQVYVKLMQATRCLVGNSSSGIREGAYIGTPTVNIGSRQNARERGSNVLDCSYSLSEIENAIRNRLALGEDHKCEPIYGNGQAGPQIADLLATQELTIEKVITY